MRRRCGVAVVLRGPSTAHNWRYPKLLRITSAQRHLGRRVGEVPRRIHHRAHPRSVKRRGVVRTLRPTVPRSCSLPSRASGSGLRAITNSVPAIVVDRATATASRARHPAPGDCDTLRGFHHHGFLHSYTSPSRLPHPSGLAVPARHGVVEAAPALPRASRVRLPPASAACCDRPQVGPCTPPGHAAPRGTPTRRWLPASPPDRSGLRQRQPKRRRVVVDPDRLALLARLVHPLDHRPAAVQIHTHVRRSTGPPLPEVLVERPRVLTRSDDPETGRTFFFVPAPPITPPMPSPPRRREYATATPSHRIT